MTQIRTALSVEMEELRDPQKVLDAAQAKPVAILKNSKLVAYPVPAERVEGGPGHCRIAKEDLQVYLRESRERVQPVLDYLQDK
jgi:antitoxin StbD